MESNGKSVQLDGSPVDAPTGAIVWGTAGTNGQHAYFQLLHQGTTLVPIDFIGFVARAARSRPRRAPGPAGRQPARAGRGARVRQDRPRSQPRRAAAVPHRTFPGNRPSSVLLADQLTPHALGALVAAYEHKVMTLGVIWGIDSFDQWGVELGKVLAGRIVERARGRRRARARATTARPTR